MTNWEYIAYMIEKRQKNIFADYLCKRFIPDCRECPATNKCYPGHNGMVEWLEQEAGDDD